eukprot:4716461-Pleurochrysis_carterae.AAC.2
MEHDAFFVLLAIAALTQQDGQQLKKPAARSVSGKMRYHWTRRSDLDLAVQRMRCRLCLKMLMHLRAGVCFDVLPSCK